MFVTKYRLKILKEFAKKVILSAFLWNICLLYFAQIVQYKKTMEQWFHFFDSENPDTGLY